jgi:hypothetical protein
VQVRLRHLREVDADFSDLGNNGVLRKMLIRAGGCLVGSNREGVAIMMQGAAPSLRRSDSAERLDPVRR